MSATDSYSEIIKLIQQTVVAKKIFVLASSQIEKQTESIFANSLFKKSQSTHHYLLLLISKEQHSVYYEIQNQIESLCQPFCSITVIAMEMEMFNEWLKEGHPFAVQTKTKALLIYDNGSISLADHNAINEKRLFEYRNELYQMGIEKMKSLYVEEKYHNAAVEGLMTILKANLGIELQTKNIDKLIDYCAIVINEMPSIFHDSNYDENPPVEKIESLLRSLYAPYKALTYISTTLTK
jgi:hypothetical protein